MANTYTQIYLQFVFAVQNRQSLIKQSWEEELYKYLTGIVQNHKHKLIAVNGVEDHIHMFIGVHPTQSISDLMKIAKRESSEWINNRGFTKGKFNWQEGYGAFSYARSQVDQVYKYVMNQKQRHKKQAFVEEYTKLLEAFHISYDEQFIFKPID